MTGLVALLSFGVGLLAGALLRDLLDLSRAAHARLTKEKPVTEATRSRTRLVLAAVLVLMLVVNGATAVLLILTRASNADYTACTARWQQDFSTSYEARVNARVKVDAAIDDIVRSFAADDMTAASNSVDRYVQIRDAQKRQQLRNPLPPLPEQVCGRPTR